MTVNLEDGTPCGTFPYNLCLSRCISGVCQVQNVTCPPDTNTSDCQAPECDSTTGECPYVAESGTGCTDGNACTISDTCNAGVCRGTPKVCPTPTSVCQTIACNFGDCQVTGLSGVPCNADNNECTVGDVCVAGVCTPGVPTVCNTTETCQVSFCDMNTGMCVLDAVTNSENVTCDDGNICTFNDVCVNGTCGGELDSSLAGSAACGFVPNNPVKNPAIIIFSVAGAAALIGAIVGIAFLARKIRNSQLMNPDSWNPDMFSSVGANPLYKGNQNVVDNALYGN